jgi:hypothetical protein
LSNLEAAGQGRDVLAGTDAPGAVVRDPNHAWFASRDWRFTARSGSLMILFAAIAQFVTLNRMNKKHLLNDCRVKANLRPWDMSKISAIVGGLSLIAALIGTLLWGYGDVLAGTQ